MKVAYYTLSYLNRQKLDAMGHLRVVSPLTQAGIEIICGVEGNKVIPEYVLEGDVVVLQRHFPSLYLDYRRVMDLAHKVKKPVVYEIDDWLLGLPAEHPDRLRHIYTPSLLPILEAILEADLVTVPTRFLREIIYPLNNHIAVLPNYFDDSIWQFRKVPFEESSNNYTIIGFMGTNSHQPDLEPLIPVLLEILHVFSQKTQLHFWGIEPPAILRNFPHVQHFPWYSYNYRDFAQYFQNQIADIFIAPLNNNLFNRCKSPLKFFEYSALGAPSIFSALEPYIDIIENGKNGFLAYTLEDWRTCLTKLIDSPNLRRQLAENAQATIQKKWLLSKNAHLWKRTYEKIISKRREDKGVLDFPFREILSSINIQIYGLIQSQQSQLSANEQEITTLMTKLHEYETKLREYEMEIVDYVTSRSWRYTRPLRKFSRLLRKLWI